MTDHFHEAPVMIVPCIEGRAEDLPQFAQASMYGSILPAVWSLMLALRSRSASAAAWTTIISCTRRKRRRSSASPTR
ncbi:MAG: hypothetical protein U1E86_28660 [Burkholderiaceae bacterium]